MMTFGGGSPSLAPKHFLAKSLVCVISQTVVLSQTPAQVLALQLLLQVTGEHAGSSQDGRLRAETLDGPRQSALSFSSTPSSLLVVLASTSGSSETIRMSSKNGGKGGIEADKPTLYSCKSMTSLLLTNALISHTMLPAKKTQQMPLPKASTYHFLSSFLLSQSQMIYGTSSQTLTVPSPPASLSSEPMDLAPILTQSPSRTLDSPPSVVNQARPLLIQPMDLNSTTFFFNLSSARPSAYAPHLAPISSPLCPYCLAQDRLCLWKPFSPCHDPNSEQYSIQVSEQDASHIFKITSNAWVDSTCEAYSSSILVYHVHCDKRNISEHLQAPISHPLATSFIASLAGSYSSSTISNYIHRIWAWHILHGLPWR
jgi:hypothetical protein